MRHDAVKKKFRRYLQDDAYDAVCEVLDTQYVGDVGAQHVAEADSSELRLVLAALHGFDDDLAFVGLSTFFPYLYPFLAPNFLKIIK